MLSIGEIAHSTGTTRRMLRHWERFGLIQPAEVDPHTGYRRYAASQVGRVQAVAALRALGFSLEAIGGLLDAGLTQDRLVHLLRERGGELVAQIDDASTSLAQVRSRLLAYEEGHAMISSTLELGALPALHLLAVQTTVLDESEIGPALTQLLATLRDVVPATVSSAVDLVLIYDGRAEEKIVVSAGHPGLEARPGLHQVDVPAEPDGVTVTFPDGLSDVGDAWIALDAGLAERDLRSTGIYRQVVTPAGLVLLQAPVRPR